MSQLWLFGAPPPPPPPKPKGRPRSTAAAPADPPPVAPSPSPAAPVEAPTEAPTEEPTEAPIVFCGDCVEVMAELPEESVGAVVCDPPYGIEFMGKNFDKLGAVKKQHEWHLRWVSQAFRVLRPGGVLKAFVATRTFHRLAAAMAEAGFVEIGLEAWTYASGFPKSRDISKEIDKLDRIGPMDARARQFTAWMRSTGITCGQINEATGSYMGSHYLTDKQQPHVATAELFNKLRPLLPPVPEEIEELVRSRTIESENLKRRKVVESKPGAKLEYSPGVDVEPRETEVQVTEPYTAEAQRWRGWGTALKPAWEPCLIGRKP